MGSCRMTIKGVEETSLFWFCPVTEDDINNGLTLFDLMIKTELCGSNREIREKIKNNNITFNNEKVKRNDPNLKITKEFFIDDRLILWSGKSAREIVII